MSITKISPSVVDFDAGITISTADNLDTLTLTSTDADANAGPNLRLYRNSGTPADSDALGLIEFEGRNDNTQDVVYAGIDSRIVDASDGTEDGRIEIVTMLAGTAGISRILMDATETVFNDNSADLDFRVESNDSANRLLIDAGNDKMLIGTTASRNVSGIVPALFQEAVGYTGASYGLVANSNDSNGAYILIGKSRGTSLGSSTALQNGDQIGGVYFQAADGTDISHAAAYMDAIIYGDVGNNDVPGALRFFTTPDGSATPTEKMRVMPSGGITFNGDTSTANALDDYEEGTWTPVLISGGSTNPTGGGALTPYGSYTKVGNRVTVTFYVGRSWTNTPAGQIFVSGLPFVVENVNGNTTYTQVSVYNINFGGGMTMAVPDRNAQTFNMYAVNNSSDWTQINWTSHTTSPIYLTGQFSYTV